MSSTRWLPLGGALLLAACQAVPGAGPAPSVLPSAAVGASPMATAAPSTTAPAPSAAASADATPTAMPSVAREVVLGSIFNERGGRVEAATVVVTSSDKAFERTLDANGGAYALRDVPVGTTLTLTATAPGHTARSRTITVKPIVPIYDEEPNRVDFGGDGPSLWYYLTRELEVARTTPANLARGVKADGIDLTFEFSAPIQDDERGNFADLLRIQVPGASEDDPGAGFLRSSTAVGSARARLTWEDDGRKAIYAFPFPIVAPTDETTVTVFFDPAADPEDYPKDVEGRRLGLDRVYFSRDGSGAASTNRVAPFARAVMDEAVPTVRPSPLDLWGRTHFTSVKFTLARDTKKLEVTKVRALPGSTGDDVIIVTFNKPMNGYPGGALSEATTGRGNYGLVYGRVSERQAREDFEEADPRTSGGVPSSIELDPDDPYSIVLHEPPGTFDDEQRFKLHLDPAIEDIYGVPLGGDGYQTEGEL